MQEPEDTIEKSACTEPDDKHYCICCKGMEFSPHFEGLVRCLGCGHIKASLSWTPEMFKALYTERYFKGEEYIDYEKEADAFRRNFRRRVQELAQRHPEGGRLWEIGCAYGYFLKEAGAHFSAAGCDVASEAVQAAAEKNGVNAQCLDYLTYAPDAPFDVVCLWDTIEHLADPSLYLKKAFDDLRPGGTLALSTGDIGSLCARLRGRRWRQIHPPTHVHYFTRNSMRQLLQRLGYAQIHFHYPAVWRNADTSLEKVVSGVPFANILYAGCKRAGLLRFDFPLNSFDLMTVYAIKPLDT